MLTNEPTMDVSFSGQQFLLNSFVSVFFSRPSILINDKPVRDPVCYVVTTMAIFTSFFILVPFFFGTRYPTICKTICSGHSASVIIYDRYEQSSVESVSLLLSSY
jgi:hypothetical protein